MKQNAQYYISTLNLSKHPEGGWYREVYRSNENINKEDLPARFGGSRCFGTSIYFLLEGNEYSAFHRINSDETWHFYAGSAITIYIIDTTGALKLIELNDTDTFQYTVPAECWFAAKLKDPNTFALVGCTVNPGFDFADFELAEKETMKLKFPQYKLLFDELCI